MNRFEPRALLISFSELPTLQRHLYVLSEELCKLDYDVTTIGSRNLQINVELGSANHLIETPSSPKPSLASLCAMNRSLDELVNYIVEAKPGIIHFTNKHTWNYFLLLKLKKKLPEAVYVHTFHDPIGHEGDSVQKGVILYHKLVQRHLDGVVVHSEIAKKQALERLKTKCSVFQVPLGEKPWKPFAPSACDNKEVLIFGRLNPYKGIKYYSSIFEELYQIDSSVHVTVAGKAANEVDADVLQKFAKKPNCSLVNSFIDESDIDSYFERAGVVLVPYTSITQSGVILDAYSRSRAVVAFDIPGMAQYVPDRENRIKPFDCRAFAQRAVSLLGDKQAAKNAWSFGKDRFSPDKMAQAVADVYKKLTVTK